MSTIEHQDAPSALTFCHSPEVLAGFALAADGEMSDAITLGLPQTHNELPIHYRWQKVTVAGKYKHPSKGYDVAIDEPRCQKWVKNTKLALANGVDIPASKVHGLDEKPFGYRKPENTLGNIVDARVRNGEMEVLAGYYGDAAFDIAQKNKVSVGIEMNVSDSKGNKYDELLTHLCVTPTPVLPGTSTGFVTLSRDEQTEAISPLVPQQKGVEMLDSALKARVTQYLGDTAIPEDSNEVIPLLLGEIDKLKPDAAKAVALSSENETLKTKVLTLSKEEPSDDPRYANLAYKAAKSEVGSLVATGVIRKADEPLLLSLIETEAGKPNVMLLSREDATTGITFDRVIDIVKRVRPGLIGREQTAAQTLALAREVPGSEAETTAADTIEAARAEAAAYEAKLRQARGMSA